MILYQETLCESKWQVFKINEKLILEIFRVNLLNIRYPDKDHIRSNYISSEWEPYRLWYWFVVGMFYSIMPSIVHKRF